MIDSWIWAVSAEYYNHLVFCNMNVDLARVEDPSYYRQKMLKPHMDCVAECGLEVSNELDMSPTFISHSTFEGKNGTVCQKNSTLDHVY